MLTLVSISLLAAAVSTSPDVPLSRYEAVTLAGWPVLVSPDAHRDETRFGRVRAALLVDLETVARVVPDGALSTLHRVRIVITPKTTPREGLSGRGMCYHESAAWLTSHGFDAQREGVVEICDMDDFLSWRAEQPMMVLHELSHAYHAHLGPRQKLTEAYESARRAGLYRAVPYVLAADGERRDAYALTNEKEYFAELSEAYLGRNDYYPFTREELGTYDAAGLEAVRSMWSQGRSP